MEYISLNKICDVRDGTHDSPRYVLSGYPLVTSKNIVDGKLDLSTVNYLSQEDYDKINARSKVDIGDIIMPMIGTIGNPFLVNEDPNYAIKNVALIKFPNKNISNRFIWYFLKSGAFKKYVSEKNKGGTQKFLSLGDIRNMNVPLVSLDNQLEIVEKLDSISQIIDKKRLELNALDRLIKARFVELLQPVFDQDNTEALINLVDERRPITYGILKPGTNVEGGCPVIRVKDFSRGLVSVDDVLHTSQDIYDKYLRSTLDEGDIIISIGGTIGRVAIIPHEFVGANITQHTARIALKDKRFLFYYRGLLESDIMQRWMKERVLGIAQPSMNLGDVKKMPIPKVDESAKKELNDFVKQVDKSKSVVQKSLDAAQMLFDSLMQKYFG